MLSGKVEAHVHVELLVTILLLELISHEFLGIARLLKHSFQVVVCCCDCKNND